MRRSSALRDFAMVDDLASIGHGVVDKLFRRDFYAKEVEPHNGLLDVWVYR
jgi:hypothetical protein